MSNLQTIKDIKPNLEKELSGIYPPEEIIAFTSIIIKTVFRVSGLHLIYDQGRHLTRKQAERILSILSELKAGRPLQYILGETSFYNCKIRVNPGVLIPRPESEELTDMIIRENKNFRGRILDVGTGSGCVAIALAVNMPGSQITGTDISDIAINVAAENAKLNGVSVTFIKNDIFSPDLKLFPDTGLLVSNPPYVRESEKRLMASNVLDHEPHIALFVPDTDPLIFYRAIIRMAETVLIPGGRIYFEINEAMGDEMHRLLSSAGYDDVTVVRDINDKDRFVKGIKN